MNTEWFGLAQCIIVGLTGLIGAIWVISMIVGDDELDALWLLFTLLAAIPSVFFCLWAYESVIGFIAGMSLYLLIGGPFLHHVWKVRSRHVKTTYPDFNKYR